MATRAKKIADLEFIDAAITGGTIDGSSIGATTRSSGLFTAGGFNDGLYVSRDGDLPLTVDRGTDNDGDLIQFRNQGFLIGTFGFRNSGLFIGNANTSIRFDNQSNCIRPVNHDGENLDNTVSLGFNVAQDQARYKDLHLSGTAYVGGDLFCNEKAKIGNVDNTGGKSLMVGDTGSNSGYAGFGVGMNHSITGDLNVVGGYFNDVTGNNNAVFGSNQSVHCPTLGEDADQNLVAGNGHFVKGKRCLVAGETNVVSDSALNSVCVGYNNEVTANNAFSGGGDFGRPTKAGAVNSFAYGGGCQTNYNAVNSVALGALTECGGGTTSANQSMAIGYQSIAYADNSFAGGNESFAFGDTSFAFGNGATASKGFSNIALGRGVTTPTSASAANMPGAVSVGQWNEHAVTTEQHFSVGTGTSDGQRYTSFYVGPRTNSNANIVMKALLASSSYSSDYGAAYAGVPLGGLYRNGNDVKIRIS